MDYIGSKEKLNDWIFSKILINFSTKQIENLVFVDACSGSGAVSRYAANLGLKVISNDLLKFSQCVVIGSTSLPKNKIKIVDKHIEIMNNLSGKSGFFYKNYSANSGRLYFSNNNAKKIDACRSYIEEIKEEEIIKTYLLYCLLEAMNRVSNTVGVQAAFLKHLKQRSSNDLEIRQEKTLHSKNVIAFNENIISLLSSESYRSKIEEDILYIDPPYNGRQYAPNYHLYETLVKYDNPEISGKTGLRDWKDNKSEFCSKKTCLNFLFNVINKTTAKRIYVSYSSDGIVSREEIENFFLKKEYRVSTHVLAQKRFKSDSSSERTYDDSDLNEFLFEIYKPNSDERYIAKIKNKNLNKRKK